MVSFALSALILIIASILASAAIWSRADTLDDLNLIRVWDVVIGLLFAAAFVVMRLRDFAATTWRREMPTVASTLAIWLFFSGALLLWHEAIVKVRWAAPRTLTQNRMKMATAALDEFAKDCGRFPSKEEGLNALVQNPGIAKWAGPYLSAEELLDSWGNPLQYRILDNDLECWSMGRDGLDGTDDDIRRMRDPPK